MNIPDKSVGIGLIRVDWVFVGSLFSHREEIS